MPTARSVEIEFFRMLNRLVEPRIRAGCAAPRLVPGGFVVLEVTGRKSGRRSRVPLAAARFQGHVLVSTFRGKRSQWIRNLAANPDVRFWLRGRPRSARAFVISPGRPFRRPRHLPPLLRWATAFLVPYTYAGWAFAILTPQVEVARQATRRSR